MKAIIVCVCCGERRDVQAGVARLPERARDIAKFIHGAEVSSLLPEPGDGYAYDETPQQYVSWAIFARLPRPRPLLRVSYRSRECAADKFGLESIPVSSDSYSETNCHHHIILTTWGSGSDHQ